MAMARKCDRCGKFYTENTARVNGRVVGTIAFVNINCVDDPYDLCGGCMEDLKRFMGITDEPEQKDE